MVQLLILQHICVFIKSITAILIRIVKIIAVVLYYRIQMQKPAQVKPHFLMENNVLDVNYLLILVLLL